MDSVNGNGNLPIEPRRNILIEAKEQVRESVAPLPKKEGLSGAFFWLSAFYFVYCARPEDWIPGLAYIPLAKFTGLFAFVALLMSAGRTKRRFRDLPQEGRYLVALVCLLIPSALLSPVWRGGALIHALDFSKVAVAWVLTFLLVTNFEKLRRIIFIQAASVAIIAVVSVAKAHDAPRLQGVLGGIYANPNDLAFAIVLSLPFCLAFLLQARGLLRKLVWFFSMLVMAGALFLTASRGGFIEFVVAGSVCLWHFGVRGRRPQLIAACFLIGMVFLVGAGGKLKSRFAAISGDINSSLDQSAYGSYEERQALIMTSLKGMMQYPLLGVGVHNFTTYSGRWKEVHNSYLQMGVEGGIPALVLYLMFFWSGFSNLRRLRKRRDLDPQITLFVGALHSSLVGFIVGALFSPEAYQFFPYFAVAQTSVILAIVLEREGGASPEAQLSKPSRIRRYRYLSSGDSSTVPSIR
jgi:O-antigen ligase